MFAEDAHDMINRITQTSRERGEELPIEDGFELYKTLKGIRRLYAEAIQE